MVKESKDPGAILVRSQDLHKFEFGPSLRAVGPRRRRRQQHPGRGAVQARHPGVQRAGRQRQRGEGAGARRHADRGAQPRARRSNSSKTWTTTISRRRSRTARSSSPASSCPATRSGVIGLGKIGSLVADAAIRLGMNVLGYDPHITVEAAWSLPSQVKRAALGRRGAEGEPLRHPARAAGGEDPRTWSTRRTSSHLRHGAVLLNFSREGVVDEDAVLKGLESGRLKWYVTDFPSAGADRHTRRDRAAAPRRLDRARPRTTAR